MIDTAFVPADDDVRQAIRTRVGENMCVEAGAGTGKTTVLVDRIVEILRTTETRAEELAVITFTEKAAAELSSRVRQGLEQALATADGVHRDRIERALRELSRAHIETIHAFASSLLRERPVEAGIDPGFKVLDEMPGQLAFDTAWSEWINGQMAEDPPPQALLDALDLGLDFPRVREAAVKLNDHRDMLPLGTYAMPDIDAAAFFQGLDGAATFLRALNPRMRDETDRAYLAIPEFLRAADEVLRLRSRQESLPRAVADSDVKSQANRGSQKNWVDANDCREVKKAEARIYDLITAYRNDLRQAATAELLGWLEGFVRYYEAERRAHGEADFNDLLIWARNLVRDSEEVRRYFGRRYTRILVDEFQDTDPLQAEMIVRICAEDDPGIDWRRAKLRPGSLFVVGDPKQSIYRFRRADIGMYDDVKRQIFGGAPLEITQNFRSVTPIIDWVNGTFHGLMKEDTGIQPRYIDLTPDARKEADGEAVTYLDATADGAAAPDVRRAESAVVAALINREIAAGAWTVRERDGSVRAARFGDVAVLIPNRTSLFMYEQAFARAEMPYRHEGGRTFFARQEVRELVAVLRAIDDPADEVAAVAALRSSAFGCSDEDLFLYRDHASFGHTRVRDDATGDVADALRMLRTFARARHDMPLPDLIRDVLGRTRLVEFAMLQPQGDQVAANLLKVIDQARAFVDARGAGLRGFVRWLKDNVTKASDPRYGSVPEAEAAISEETDDVVRVLTIHASKGLEFPIVVFANMDTERSSQTSVIISHDGSGPPIEMRIGRKDDGFQTPGYEAAEVLEEKHRIAEDQRLLYVATTRARDRLVVPIIEKPAATGRQSGPQERGNREGLNGMLRRGMTAEPAEAHIAAAAHVAANTLAVIGGEPPVWRRPIIDAAEADIRDIRDTRDTWAAARGELRANANAGLVVTSATSIKLDADPPSSPEGVIRRARAADFGTAVHALLERIDLGRPDDAAALSVAVAREYALPGRESDIEEVARRALASDAVARARRSRRLLREAPFTARLPDVSGAVGLAEGRIDLLFEDDGPDGPGIVVVDFKTDSVTPAEADLRTSNIYRTQALVYAWAVERATGGRVREVVFLFARPQPAVESTIAVDGAFRAEAEALMRDQLTLAL